MLPWWAGPALQTVADGGGQGWRSPSYDYRTSSPTMLQALIGDGGGQLSSAYATIASVPCSFQGWLTHTSTNRVGPVELLWWGAGPVLQSVAASGGRGQFS